MNISFNLKNPSAKVSPIRLIVTSNNKLYRKAIGLSCETKYWSKTKKKTGNKVIDEKLRSIRIMLEEVLDDNCTPEQIDAAMTKAVNGEDSNTIEEVKAVPTFWELFETWSQRPMKAFRQNKLAYNNIRKIMGDKDNWADITVSYYSRLVRLMEKKGWSVNYQGHMVKCLKSVMHEGYNLGYHKNQSFWEFKKLQESTDKIYLTEEEMNRIWNLELTASMQRKARDLAWLGYLTCSRFSDYSRLSKKNIGDDGKIRFSQVKTGDTVVLPCSPRILEIFDRNDGAAPKLSATNFNKEIKDICKQAGIDDMIEYTISKGDQHIQLRETKYNLVSSHTFRRSAATNLYLKGVPLKSIMHLTGHSSIAMLERYLKVSKEENAERLLDNDFFK